MGNDTCVSNTLNIRLPLAFCMENACLNWADICFAVESGYMMSCDAIDFALMRLEQKFPTAEETALAGLVLERQCAEETVVHLLQQLAKETSLEAQCAAKEKIFFLVLKWVYEHKRSYLDPLEVVEFIFDDFNFPKEMRPFVRYVPSDEIPLPSRRLNVRRLYQNWEKYLVQQSAIWR